MSETELTIEERAKIMGHVPLEDFKGDPEKWVTAEAWVERADKLLPINRATLRKLTEDISEMKTAFGQERTSLATEITTLKRTLKEFGEFSKKAEERAYTKAIKELEERQRQAVVDADVEAYDKVAVELADLKEEPVVVAAVAAADDKSVLPAADDKPKVWPEVSDPAIFTTWIGENDWYKTDPEMADYAHRMDVWLKNTVVMPTQQAQLEKIVELVKKKFPQYWSNENKTKPQTVEGGGDGAGPAGGGRGKKTYVDLPADAKRYCDEWAGKDGKGTSGTIRGFTRQDYVDQYQWDK